MNKINYEEQAEALEKKESKLFESGKKRQWLFILDDRDSDYATWIYENKQEKEFESFCKEHKLSKKKKKAEFELAKKGKGAFSKELKKNTKGKFYDEYCELNQEELIKWQEEYEDDEREAYLLEQKQELIDYNKTNTLF